jgi:hypothetical protein
VSMELVRASVGTRGVGREMPGGGSRGGCSGVLPSFPFSSTRQNPECGWPPLNTRFQVGCCPFGVRVRVDPNDGRNES